MVNERIKGYELDLLYGRDIYIKGVKIRNYTLGEIDKLVFNEEFYKLKRHLTEFKDINDVGKNIQLNVDVLATFLVCENASYNAGISTYCIQHSVEDKVSIVTLTDKELEVVFLLLKEMYWCNNAGKGNGLIDESKAADENALKRIKEINETRTKFANSKKDSRVTLFSSIERCASLGIGGYNFKTIQDITLYQLQCLIDSHTSDVIFRGFLSGLYSQSDMTKLNMADVYWCNEQ